MSEPPDAVALALARVPDLPLWIDTRGMLLTGRARVSFPGEAPGPTDGFVVELASRALLAAVDDPPADLIAGRALAMPGYANILCAIEHAAPLQRALAGWVRRDALIQALPGIAPWEAHQEEDVAIFTRTDAPSLAHVPGHLRDELMRALAGHPSARFVPGALPAPQAADLSPTAIPVAAAWVDGLPAAFCYPVLQTETLWDVAIETMPGHRGRGLAGRAARAMIRYLRSRGKAPVWGALDANAASLSVARQLGFAAAGRLAVFTPG